jgi:hypothetical protein
MLHPHTVRLNESIPSTAELLSDGNVPITSGNNFEGAVAVQEEAESLYADQCNAEAAAEQDAREADIQTAEQELLNVATRYGHDEAAGVTLRVSAKLVERTEADAKRDATIEAFNDDPVNQMEMAKHSAWSALMDLACKYGWNACFDVTRDAVEEMTRRGIRPAIPSLRPITTKVRKLDMSKYGIDPDNKPAA